MTLSIHSLTSNSVLPFPGSSPLAGVSSEHALSVSDYALQYLETFKKPNISDKHFYNLSGIVRRHIFHFFGDKLLQELTATDCQKFLNELIQSGKFRTAEDAKSILDWVKALRIVS